MTEYNQRLRALAEQLGTFDTSIILEAFVKGLTVHQLRAAMLVMAKPYVHQVVSTQSQPRTGRQVVTAIEDVKESWPVGVPKNASREHLLKKAPHLAGHLNALERRSNEQFTRFGRSFIWSRLTVADLHWIAGEYRKLGNTYLRIADRVDGVAQGLRTRRASQLGDLPPQVLEGMIVKITEAEALAA